MRDDNCNYITAEAFLLARQSARQKEENRLARKKYRRAFFVTIGALSIFLLASWSY